MYLVCGLLCLLSGLLLIRSYWGFDMVISKIRGLLRSHYLWIL